MTTKAPALPPAPVARPATPSHPDRIAAMVRTLSGGIPEIDAVIVLLTRTPIAVDTAKVAHKLLAVALHDCLNDCGYVEDDQVALLNLLKRHLHDDHGITFEDGGWRNFRAEAAR